MTDRPRYIHRTLKAAPSDYERALAAALLPILARKVHDLPGIVAALNASEVKHPDGTAWSEENFAAAMTLLGAYPNSVGGPLGTHPVGIAPPGNPSAERPQRANQRGQVHAE